jgi:hypothetical protein
MNDPISWRLASLTNSRPQLRLEFIPKRGEILS